MRKADYPILDVILNRISKRAFSDEMLSDEELMSLFEAARWAPSSYNNQPWRFLYAKRGTKNWDILFDLLVDFNKQWTKNAPVLVLLISKKIFSGMRGPSEKMNGKMATTHSFDAGAAWENLALQASANGIIAHGMQGFDYERARLLFRVPSDYQVEALLAIGKEGEADSLSSELAAKDKTPSVRKPLKEIICEGPFAWND